jgi:pyrroline-5-carboxylate reductase
LKGHEKLAIIGAGNIGMAIANGLVKAKRFNKDQIILSDKDKSVLEIHARSGFKVSENNIQAINEGNIILIAVEPHQIVNLLSEIGTELKPEKHTLISVVAGVSIDEIIKHIGVNIPVVRAMPNTAIAIQESMTCLSTNDSDGKALDLAESIFNTVGEILVISEDKMIPATALGACGIAFFLRVIRAASQGGIEIGFHAHEAIKIAAQTSKGAAKLLLNTGNHPEQEIDKVTTPRGCTISGLNQMEHEGFSSALIKGIITSCEKAAQLYEKKGSKD